MQVKWALEKLKTEEAVIIFRIKNTLMKHFTQLDWF